MKTLEETIELLSLKQHMNPTVHPMEIDEIKDALWYLRDYRDMLQSISKLKLAYDIIDYYVKKDLKNENA